MIRREKMMEEMITARGGMNMHMNSNNNTCRLNQRNIAKSQMHEQDRVKSKKWGYVE